jgi:hypothetical protein
VTRDRWPGTWFRPVVSVKELYRTKRGEPVGEATLACGHVALVDMNRKAVRRACWSCKQEKRVAWRVRPATKETP